jgi:hypothetical protein
MSRVVVLPHGEYFCATCGQALQFGHRATMQSVMAAESQRGWCPGYGCPMRDKHLLIPLQHLVVEDAPPESP